MPLLLIAPPGWSGSSEPSFEIANANGLERMAKFICFVDQDSSLFGYSISNMQAFANSILI